ncbi:hypothetical protein BSKO_14163 [Bryopsis sp. KO-2023]|nr:hypothetical protein BSKO_14163 [Bryopsis sp. KO-2023]
MGGNIMIDAPSELAMSWKVIESDYGPKIELNLKMKTQGPGYMLVGFEGEEKGFVGADAIVVTLVGNSCRAFDYWIEDKENPKLDPMLGGVTDVSLESCSTSGGYLEAVLSRPAETIDIWDNPVEKGVFTDVIFAWNTQIPELMLDGTNERRASINFFAEVGSESWKWATPLDDAQNGGDEPNESENGQGDGGEESSSTISGEVTLDESTEFILTWELKSDAMKFDMSFKGTGFAGIGIPGQDRNMHAADIMIAAADGNGGCTVGDYWSETFAKPSLDEDMGGTDDLAEKSCSIEDGYIKASFERPLTTEDDNDREIPSSNIPLIYAYHASSDGIGYHGVSGRGVVDIDVTSGSGGDSEGSPEDLLAVEFDDGASKELAEGYKVWWKLVDQEAPGRRLLGEVSDDQEIIIKMQRQSTGWMGLGIQPADASVSGMQETDMYIGWVEDDGTVTLIDAWAIGFLKPEGDDAQGGTNDILSFAGEEKDGTTTIIFKRKINTGDDFDRVIKDKDQDIVFAFGDSDGLPPGGHGPNRGKDKNNFTIQPEGGSDTDGSKSGSGGNKGPNRSLIVAHAWFMVLAWGLLCVMGLVMSRLTRHWKYWMQVHIACELGAVLISLIGEIMAFSYSQGKVRYAHGAISFIILFTSVPQLFLGWIASKSNTATIKKLHRAVGYFIVGVAFWQMWMGMQILEVDEKLVQCFYAWIISIVVSFHFASESVTHDGMYHALVKRGFLSEEDPEQGNTGASQSSTGKDNAKSAPQKGNNTDYGSQISQKLNKMNTNSFTNVAAQDTIPAYKEPTSTKDEPKGSMNISPADFMESIGNNKKWTVIHGQVYDMEQMVTTHPGGSQYILDIIGKDGTELYMEHHAESETAHQMLQETLLGKLTGTEIDIG